MSKADRSGGIRIAAQIGVAIAFVAYPFLVYAGLVSWSPRWAALVLLVVFLPVAIARLRTMRRGALRALALLPFVTVTGLVLAAVLNSAGFVLVVPVAISALALLTFGPTLWTDTPMVERFARLQVEDLSPAELRWCRQWTIAWCVFFVVNGTTALLLALYADLQAWALYNGLIAYALMGAMFSVEYIFRRLQFGRCGAGPIDRFLQRGHIRWLKRRTPRR